MVIDLFLLRKALDLQVSIPEQVTKVNKKMTFVQLAMDKTMRTNIACLIEVAAYKNPQCT